MESRLFEVRFCISSVFSLLCIFCLKYLFYIFLAIAVDLLNKSRGVAGIVLRTCWISPKDILNKFQGPSEQIPRTCWTSLKDLLNKSQGLSEQDPRLAEQILRSCWTSPLTMLKKTRRLARQVPRTSSNTIITSQPYQESSETWFTLHNLSSQAHRLVSFVVCLIQLWFFVSSRSPQTSEQWLYKYLDIFHRFC